MLPPPLLQVTATDQGIPQRASTAEVQINVWRNLYDPRFDQAVREIEVDERMAAGSIVLNVTAFDPDAREQPNVSIFEGAILFILHIIGNGNMPSPLLQYQEIHATSRSTVIQSLQ